MTKYNQDLTEQIKQEVLLVHDSFWKALGERDIEKRFIDCDDAITFIGSGLNEKAANKEEYIAINKKGIEQYPDQFAMNILWKRVSVSQNLAWVETEVEWAIIIEGKTEKEMLRNTVVLQKRENRWFIVHVHGSMPDYRLAGQNYMTNADTSKRNVELEQQVFNRTKELNQAMENLKATQSQLIQAEKMASLGELTAGIAHEIQNPLNFVNNFSEVNIELISELVDEVEKGNTAEVKLLANDIKENSEKINHHGKRADSIVKGMLQHSSSGNGKKEPTDINKLTDEYLRLAYHGLRAKDKSFNATLKTEYDESISMINIVPQDMGRVILNLITNAFFAVHEKRKQGIANYEPTVTIKTHKPSSSGLGVVISVSDNGPGIPQKIIDKIFQPFFTTKPTGQGTGLGLSLAYDIVKAHGGELKVETKEKNGTIFTIVLNATC
jgi:C4-dicarboxylate-specific signal transduction histidine kinase